MRYKNADKWETASQLTYEFLRENGLWTIARSGLNQRENDLEFFEIGSRPEADKRYFFLPTANADHSTYFQRREQEKVARQAMSLLTSRYSLLVDAVKNTSGTKNGHQRRHRKSI